MIDLYLCHAPADQELAATIQARLDRGAEAKVWLEPCGRAAAQSLAEAWDGGLSSAGIVLLLSPDAIPERLPRERWQALLDHIGGNAAPPVASVLTGACPYPPMLERKHFIRWDGQAPRKIERWALDLHPHSGPPPFVPARLPWFAGRDREIDLLWTEAVDNSASIVLVNPQPGSGKSALAQEFARRASSHFRDILWVACGGRSQVSIAGDIASQLGVTLEGGPGDAFARLSLVLQEHRLLVVLDDLTSEPPIATSPGGRASLLITTKRRDLEMPLHCRILQIDCADPCPISEPPADSVELRLWQAAAVCRPHVFPLELAAAIAEIDAPRALDEAARLVERRWLDPVDGSRRFRLARPAAPGSESLHRRHAEFIDDAFSHWRMQPELCASLLLELDSAFAWAKRSDWRLAVKLAHYCCAYLKSQTRSLEAVEVYIRLQEAAIERRDTEAANVCAWELSWLRDETGAMRPPPAAADQLTFGFA